MTTPNGRNATGDPLPFARDARADVLRSETPAPDDERRGAPLNEKNGCIGTTRGRSSIAVALAMRDQRQPAPIGTAIGSAPKQHRAPGQRVVAADGQGVAASALRRERLLQIAPEVVRMFAANAKPEEAGW